MEENKPLETKQCVRCKQRKPVAEFHRSSSNPDGYQSYCKECQRQAARMRRLKPSDHKEPNPALADFDSGELVDELRVRGYKGKLTFMVQKTIVL